MVTIKTVLRSGGVYTAEHVLRMRDMIEQHVRIPYKFVCYSDVPIEGVETRELLHDWPGWWSKLEIFRDVEESFYIDLDMTITGDISDIVAVETEFMALRNLNPKIAGIGSAMMKWSGDFKRFYQLFRCDPHHVTESFGLDKVGTPWLGDQGWIWSIHQDSEETFDLKYFQDRFPNRIKKFTQIGGDIKVYFGSNKPWTRG